MIGQEAAGSPRETGLENISRYLLAYTSLIFRIVIIITLWDNW